MYLLFAQGSPTGKPVVTPSGGGAGGKSGKSSTSKASKAASGSSEHLMAGDGSMSLDMSIGFDTFGRRD